MFSTLLFSAASLVMPSEAASCESVMAEAAKAPGSEVGAAYTRVAACDKDVAEANFTVLMERATEVDWLVDLCVAAINSDGWNAVWGTIGKISDYEARDIVAEQIGTRCPAEPKIVQFLQGAYFGLKDIDFQQWDDAFMACEDSKIDSWLVQEVSKPPNTTFDDKYNAIVGILARKKGVEALPTLTAAAIKAASDGPYNSILMAMDSAVGGELGEMPSAEEQKALEDALVKVAAKVSSDQARSVADRLANAGATDKAAALIPGIYKDKLSASGTLLYGAASVERADCKGTKTVVIHYAEVTEPAKRWVLLDDLEAPMKEFKPKLTKCESEGDWAVAATPEPVGGSKDVSNWVFALEKQWQEKGYDVSSRAEKPIILN